MPEAITNAQVAGTIADMRRQAHELSEWLQSEAMFAYDASHAAHFARVEDALSHIGMSLITAEVYSRGIVEDREDRAAEKRAAVERKPQVRGFSHLDDRGAA